MLPQNLNQKSEDALKQIIFMGLCLIIAFPLLGDYGQLLFPLGRDIFFRIIIEILLLFYLLLVLNNKAFFFKINFFVLSLFLFWLITGLATLFSVQPTFSFFGNFFRGQGFFSQTHFFIFFLLLGAVLEDFKSWKKIIWLSVIVSFLVSLIVLLQLINRTINPAPSSTLNNPNFLAAYLLLVIFMTLGLFFQEKRPFLLKGENASKKGFLIISFLVQFLGIIFSQSQGAMAALLAGLLLFFSVFGWLKIKTKKTKIVFLISLILVLIVFLFLIWQKMQTFLIFQIINNFGQPFLDQSQNLLRRSSEARLKAWQAAFQAIKYKPLFGFGPENFVVAFDRFYNGSLEGTTYPWYDKAHNVFLEIATTSGLLGLGAYLAIWFFAFKSLFPLKKNPMIKIGLLATFASYLVQNFFNIDTTTSLIYVYLWWALANFLGSQKYE